MKGKNAITHSPNSSIQRGLSSRLIIFTRYPTPGSAKTRLIPALGPEGAANLQRQLTEHTLANLLPMVEENIHVQIRFEGGDRGEMNAWLGGDLSMVDQGKGDLGHRMRNAFNESFQEGFDKVVIVGTDCPYLTVDDVKETLDLLRNNILVLGPATDGGYYLIGISSAAPEWLYDLIFENIPWGTSQVFNTTVNAIAETGLNMGLLDEKSDVDEPEDLVHWEGEIGTKGEQWRVLKEGELSLSVIVPVLNEEENIKLVIDRLKKTEVEVVVADGGSTDRTVTLCEEEGIKLVHTSGGRAAQMNAGASEASGNVFLFLHADTTLPVGFADRVKEAVLEGAVGGAFLFGTDSDKASMSIIENAAHFRSWRLGIVFGDQAIFATREAFYRAGTYPDQPIMEDYEFWKRLGSVGRRSLIPQSATTSARKWEKHGIWHTTLIHQTVMWLYILGINPEKLARWFEKKFKG